MLEVGSTPPQSWCAFGFLFIHFPFISYILASSLSPSSKGRGESCPKPSNIPGGHLSSRDCLGLSAPSLVALTALELRQAGQWALGHGAPGKPSSAPLRPRAAQRLPGTRHSLMPAPSSGKYNHSHWAIRASFVEISSIEILYLHLGENITNV